METDNLEMVEQAKKYLDSTSKWMKFLAIILCISVGSMFIVAIAMLAGSSLMNRFAGYENFPGWIFGVLYLLLACVYVLPIIYMFRASASARDVVELNDNEMLLEFLKNNKSIWKFFGIFTIVSLVFVALCVPLAIIAAAAL